MFNDTVDTIFTMIIIAFKDHFCHHMIINKCMITITIQAAVPRTLWAKREHTRASLGDQQLLFSPGEE